MIAQHPPELSINEMASDKQDKRLTNGTKLLQKTSFHAGVAALRFRSASSLNAPGAFFQVVEAGFDRVMPEKALTEGLEVYRELLDKEGKPVTRTQLGEPITIRLRVRSLRPEPVTNVAVIDLLPGGFEVVGSSLQPGVSSINGVDYVEIREDRAVFFATIPTQTLEITYQIKSDNRGQFVVPPVFAESMYDRNVKARGVGGKISVVENGK